MHPTLVITCPEPANERLGYGVILISSDWICRLVPYFHTDAEIAPNFAKISRCPHLAPCRNQTAQRLKTGNYSFERGIIALHLAGKIRRSSFTCFRGRVANSLYKFHLMASLALLSFARWRRGYRAYLALLWRMTQ